MGDWHLDNMSPSDVYFGHIIPNRASLHENSIISLQKKVSS